MSKKGLKQAQISIFVIIAIVVVISIILIFIFWQQPFLKYRATEDPQAYIQQCLEPSLEDISEQVMIHGGYLNPDFSLRYKGEERAYICHSDGIEKICTTLDPMLTSSIEAEIIQGIEEDVIDCFSIFDSSQTIDYEVEVKPKHILLKIDKEITIIRQGEMIDFDVFNVDITSPLYDMISLVNQIVNQEVDCDCVRESCNADVLALSRQNKDFEIERYVSGRNEKVYTIKDLLTEKEFVFAVRNCVRLPE